MQARSTEPKKRKTPASPEAVPPGHPDALDEVPSLEASLVYEEANDRDDARDPPPVRDLRTRRG